MDFTLLVIFEKFAGVLVKIIDVEVQSTQENKNPDNYYFGYVHK